MAFNSLIFLSFIALLLSLYWGVKTDRWRHPLLFAANFLFYGWWDWRFAGLLLLVIIFSWAGGLWIARELGSAGGNPRRALFVCCVTELAVLGYFKYANFFVSSLKQSLGAAGIDVGWTTLNIVLPAGISFYIFQAISYLATVYQRKLEVERSFLKIGVYLGFFPHLVAGPIIRAHLFLPQLGAPRVFDAALFFEGLRKFAIGFLYKVVFADNLAAVVNPVYAAVAGQSGAALFGASLGFYGQIYFDFAGYSLMAIGTANSLGYTIPDNFCFPYRATSVVEFWRRWHISLSTWLRDYVYIPLGGSRCGVARRYLNLTVTMLLGGLWHGASWNFVLWGGLHGAALCGNHLYDSWKSQLLSRGQAWGGVVKSFESVIGWILVQIFVLLCWVPFRAQSSADTATIFHGILSFLTGHGGAAPGFPWLLATVPLLADTFLVSSREHSEAGMIRNPLAASVAIVAAMLVAFLFMRSEHMPFIYFQF